MEQIEKGYHAFVSRDHVTLLHIQRSHFQVMHDTPRKRDTEVSPRTVVNARGAPTVYISKLSMFLEK